MKLYLFNRICELWYKLTPRKIRRYHIAVALLLGEENGYLTLTDKTRTKAKNELKNTVHSSWIE